MGKQATRQDKAVVLVDDKGLAVGFGCLTRSLVVACTARAKLLSKAMQRQAKDVKLLAAGLCWLLTKLARLLLAAEGNGKAKVKYDKRCWLAGNNG